MRSDITITMIVRGARAARLDKARQRYNANQN